MQFKLFTIPISDNGKLLEEMNVFLRGHKVIEVEKQLINNKYGALWCFCINFIANGQPANMVKAKVDYKNQLSADAFKIFTKLRDIRRNIAKEDAVPAYAIFTDEELAGIAQLNEITAKEIRTVKGIGQKKTEKYAERIVSELCKTENE